MVMIHRYDALLRPDEQNPSGVELIPDAVLVVKNRRLHYVGGVNTAPEDLRALIERKRVQAGVASVVGRDAHSHTFQPTWKRDEIICQRGEDEHLAGSLLSILPSETEVRNNPDLAEEIAWELRDRMVDNGVGEGVYYTTSSIPALRNMLKVMDENGFRGRVKMGYVAMNQNINNYKGVPLPGVSLEISEEEETKVVEELKQVIRDYPDMVTVIDRFPIAVNSRLRKKLVELCKETDTDFDTHVDESVGEIGTTQFLYGGKTAIQVLKEDGVFTLKGAKQVVRLAHGLLTSDEDFETLRQAKEEGCKIEVAACASSNLNLNGHRINDTGFARFPYEKWKQVGSVALGIDVGAGVTSSMCAEAAYFVARDPKMQISWQDAYRAMAPKESNLQTGSRADWVHVHPHQITLLNRLLGRIDPKERNEEIVKHILVGAAANGGMEAMYLGGRLMESRPRADRPRLKL